MFLLSNVGSFQILAIDVVVDNDDSLLDAYVVGDYKCLWYHLHSGSKLSPCIKRPRIWHTSLKENASKRGRSHPPRKLIKQNVDNSSWIPHTLCDLQRQLKDNHILSRRVPACFKWMNPISYKLFSRCRFDTVESCVRNGNVI